MATVLSTWTLICQIVCNRRLRSRFLRASETTCQGTHNRLLLTRQCLLGIQEGMPEYHVLDRNSCKLCVQCFVYMMMVFGHYLASGSARCIRGCQTTRCTVRDAVMQLLVTHAKSRQ